MTNKSCYSLAELPPASKRSVHACHLIVTAVVCALLAVFFTLPAEAGDAPSWMHTAAAAPLPSHDDKADAVTLYSEDITIVQSEGKIKKIERRAYKILRPGGKEYGLAIAEFDSERKITGMKAWCIPAQGKDYEVKDKEALDISLSGVESSELITDLKD